ncbi:MAG: iron-sulfur cluster repair di-iron protein [Flavobacteriaceae bacterium]|nr:iron-sulfur cluster repair di-iron protein [Flavobacteriaceae bacterium]
MNVQSTDIIGQLVAENYQYASIFKKYDIDFCCQGNRTIGEACDKKELDTEKVVSSLNAVNKEQTLGEPDFDSWDLDLLADYIQKKHHRYVENKIPEIQPYLDKICRVHGGRHPELHQINQLFQETAGELTMHMKKEELMLFPQIRKMVSQKGEGVKGNMKAMVDEMMHEHLNEGERFHEIMELSNNYTPPADACNTYAVTFALLKEFEEDLHRHIHLENNILFPKSIMIAEELLEIN